MGNEETPVKRVTSVARHAMTQLTQYINATDQEIQRLTLTEVHLNEKVRLLTDALRESEQQVFSSKEEVRRLVAREKDLKVQVIDLTKRADSGDESLRRRAEEAEDRASVYAERSEKLKEKADLGERLSPASRKMIDAIERLPTKMEDATLIRATPSAIPLYDTYEWQAVSDARFLILRALGEPTGEVEEK